MDNHQMMTKLEKLNECQVDGTTVREEIGVILGYVQGERVGLFVVNTFSIIEWKLIGYLISDRDGLIVEDTVEILKF